MKNVVAYCRVSTDKDDQINSLESQKKYFADYINRNPDWKLVEIYADEGITGTNVKKRKQFLKMIDDAELGLIDLILTKEISRFARNTLDSIFYTRKLKAMGIGVVFLNDNINTLDPDSELRLTIMSSIAQEESRKTSDRVKWGQKRRMEAGVVFGRNILGYHLKNGGLRVNEEEAQIIRMIFRMYLEEGKGATTITRELEERGIKTKNGNRAWTHINIYRILRNEKYVGDLLQKKTFTPDYLSHEKKYNRGEEELVYLKDHHEPIIDRSTFEKTREELKRRSTQTEEQRNRHSNRYPFSGKLKCARCGAAFVSRTRKRKNGAYRKYWQCGNKTKYGNIHALPDGYIVGCDSAAVRDDHMRELTMRVIDTLIQDKKKIKSDFLINLASALTLYENPKENPISKIEKAAERVERKKEQLIELYLDGEISKADFKSVNEKCERELERLNNEKQELSISPDTCTGTGRILKRAGPHIDRMLSFREFIDEAYGNMIEKVVVYDKNNFDCHIKAMSDIWTVEITDSCVPGYGANAETTDAKNKGDVITDQMYLYR